MVESSLQLLVGSVPAVCMLVCTVLGLGIKVPENITGALQHFAAGLLLSAVGCELLPTLLEASGWRENLFATVGFFAGMGVLIVLGALFPEAHGHDGDDDNDDDHRRRSSFFGSFSDISTGLKRLRSSTTSLHEAAKAINDVYCKTCNTFEEAGHSHESQPLVTTKGSEAATNAEADQTSPNLPLSFLAAIVVDSFMDGLLIGITGVAGRGATIIMAGSLSVEMSFVGLTLATACHGMPWSRSIPAAFAGPTVLVVGAMVGSLVTGIVEGDPSLMAGIMGFGTSALLFMVAEELLLEAHEDGEHVWWVDGCLYLGFYFGFMSTKLIPE